ncbi:MAG: CCA tRNA nucleotidyltransferase [Micrococcales bacterium]
MQTVAEALANLNKLTDSPLFAQLGQRFKDAGHELALVGGPVRDAFLGRLSPDLDFTTTATPDEILAIIKPMVNAHWDIGREFGTIGARVGDDQIEITTYRADKYEVDSRKPEVRFGTDLTEDLRRRDFTVNSMALRLPEKVFVDPFDGLKDLLDGVLRTPGKPEDSFSDDPLRMMRGARFTSQLGFEIEQQTFDAMVAMAGRIEIISAERIRDELVKLLMGANPRLGIEALVDSGIAALVLPEIPALKLEIDEHAHHKDVYEHSLKVLEQAIDYGRDYRLENDFVLRFAALMHDVGKPKTRRMEGSTVTFFAHDKVGANLTRDRMRALHFDNDTIKAVRLLISEHLRFFGYGQNDAWTDSAVRRYVRDAGEQLDRLHALTRADVTTRNKKKADRLAHAYDDLEIRIKAIAEQEELGAIRPDLNGEEIMAILDLRPSREVGEAYDWLMELRLEEGPLGPEVAKQRLLAWWASIK